MAVTTTGLLIAGGALTAASIGLQVQAGRQQRKASRAESRRQEFLAARERRQQAAAALKARSELLNVATVEGTAQTSGAISGQGIVGTQAGANVSFLNQNQLFQQRIASFQERAAKFQSFATTAKGAASLSLDAADSGLFDPPATA